jgi:anti-anti-sigma factor
VVAEEPGFEITESLQPDGVRLHLSGELDVSVIDRLQDRLSSMGRGGEIVLLDLSELSFIDSSGLNVILTAYRRAQREGWDLRVEPTMSGPVERVVTMMGLDAVFWADPDPRSAD